MDIVFDSRDDIWTARKKELFTHKLLRKFEEFIFIHKAEIMAKKEKNEIEIGITLYVDKDNPLYAHDLGKEIDQVFSRVMRKLTSQLEKYKEDHYHG